MISYELANELKEAGFPQNHECIDGKELGAGVTGACLCTPRIPTLSELIEACDWKFAALYAPDKTDEGGYQCWVADSRFPEDGVGSTAEEAVARLWLALNASAPDNGCLGAKD